MDALEVVGPLELGVLLPSAPSVPVLEAPTTDAQGCKSWEVGIARD